MNLVFLFKKSVDFLILAEFHLLITYSHLKFIRLE